MKELTMLTIVMVGTISGIGMMTFFSKQVQKALQYVRSEINV